MKIYGAFLVLPKGQVHLLSDNQVSSLFNKLGIAAKRESEEARTYAMRTYFGENVDYAIPCWSDGAMEAVAQEYEGPDMERIRGLAACIATGTPYGGHEGDSDGGGYRVPLSPPKDGPKSPTLVSSLFGE